MLCFFMLCYATGWIAPLAAPRLWTVLLGVRIGTFAMTLTLLGLRARTPVTAAALSTVVQGWGYLIAGVGPQLAGVLRGLTGGYDGMFVLMLAGVAGLWALGWLVTRPRYVDDEIAGWLPAAPPARSGAPEGAHTEVVDGDSPISSRADRDGASPPG